MRKTATVHSNDPQRAQVLLAMQGTVQTLIDVRPGNFVSFRGMADKLGENTLELVGGGEPFHIVKVTTNLENKVAHQLETIKDGKHYLLKISNLVKNGNYSGFISLHTDLARNSEIMIRVNGSIEGELSVNPKTLFIGKLSGDQPLRSGRVTVVSNTNRPFNITRLSYDEKILQVARTPISTKTGYSLELSPRLERIAPGTRQRTALAIETDVDSGERLEVLIEVFNLTQ